VSLKYLILTTQGGPTPGFYL